MTKHTPGPWLAVGGTIETEDGQCVADADVNSHDDDLRIANARLIASAPDLDMMLKAILLYGWGIERVSLYDEEGVESWRFIAPNGAEYYEIGDWYELPDPPDALREYVAKAEGSRG